MQFFCSISSHSVIFASVQLLISSRLTNIQRASDFVVFQIVTASPETRIPGGAILMLCFDGISPSWVQVLGRALNM